MVAIKASIVAYLSFLVAVNAIPTAVSESGLREADKSVSKGFQLDGPGGPDDDDFNFGKRDNVFEKRDPTCATQNLCTYEDFIGCVKKLRAIGNSKCGKTPALKFNICQDGRCKWTGEATDNRGVFCSDAAGGGVDLYKACNTNGMVGGITYANGNGNFKISIGSV
ncbi:hypothetical protein TWF718_003453 [Orbilia javanica]|uniref:Uncharacterized protein n=1 Tax=Orbilia javanica TaxID=47235 RepID=A0AAN8RA55_9PEZI